MYQTAETGHENAKFIANPIDPHQIFNLSKLTAECLCLSLDQPGIRIARISNVYGADFHSDNFLTAVIRDALQRGFVRLGVHPEGAKDYVAIADVIEMLERIALGGRYRLYNVAAGENVTNRKIMDTLREYTNCSIEWIPDAPLISAPPISIELLREEFGYAPRQLVQQFPTLIEQYRTNYAEAARRSLEVRKCDS
jgi:nucleoside-diphosphate-sugar epimerase